jgi:hypothetical protein
VRGVGQVARGDSALDSGLGLTGTSDSSLKTLVARGEPADKLKPTSGGLDLNEVFSVKPHNRKKNIRISGKVKCLFALPAHEIFKVMPFGGLIVVDVDLLTTPAASAGNHLSAGLENLFNLNHISHNRKQYITDLKNCNLFFHFFYFFF